MSLLLRFVPRAGLLCALCLALCGCWAAKSYSVQVKIDKAGGYRFFAEGLAAHLPTLYALRKFELEVKGAPPEKGAAKEAKGGHGGEKGGAMKPEDIKKRKDEILGKFRVELDTALKEPRIKLQYLTDAGDGLARFALSYAGTLSGPELIRSELMVPLSYSRHADGSITFRVKDVVPSLNAKSLNVTPEGDVSVFLAEGIEVLETNAMRKPSSPSGAYRWRLESAYPQIPYMTIRLPAQH